MRRPLPLALHPLFLITLFLPAAYPTALAPAAAPTTTTTSAAAAAEFIRSSCSSTLYPELCYRSLSAYAAAVQNDPSRLASVAVAVSLSSAAQMTAYLAGVSRGPECAADPRAAAALHDCFSVFDEAVEQIRGSLRQMRRLTGTGEELRFQISNVQTWMSAALTNEDTCVDGLDDVADGPMKAEVCGRTVSVKEVTSNALALVNRLSNS